MAIHAQWVISERGFQSLQAAGITTGWLKLWLMSAGAASVTVHTLESCGWQHEEADWRIFFADESELINTAQSVGLKLDGDRSGCADGYQTEHFLLHNPDRICWSFHRDGKSILFISQGDIAYQRASYLKRLNGGDALYPLLVVAGDEGDYPLEPGLSAVIGADQTGHLRESLLNSDGELPEVQLAALLRESRLRLRTVESCTAGAIISRIGRLPGVSDLLDRGWVTYSNAAKSEEVAVAENLIETYGAVSAEVVAAMAEGGSGAQTVAVAVSGIAGPDGGSAEKPVGTVWIAVALPGESAVTRLLQLSGSRHEIQWHVVNASLALLIQLLKGECE